MASLELGDVEAFPFVEPPAPRAIADGYQLLQELGAVDARARADAARPRARAPAASIRASAAWCSPRATRGCLAEVLVIASALSVPDPRERPLDEAAGGGPGAPARSATSARISCRCSRCGSSSRDALAREAVAPPAGRRLPRAVRVVPAPARMARRARAARRASWRSRAGSGTPQLPTAIDARALRGRSTRRCSRDCSATSACKDGEGDGYLGARGIRFHLHPGSGLAKKGRSGCWPPSSSRPRGSSRAARRRSSPSGSRRSPAIASRATTSSRTGTTSAARSSRASACSSTG